jgi:hypothetical protein
MTAQTATVETLTAQVSTLVVGSRQVTLSVARQLDVMSDKTLYACFFGWVKSILGPTAHATDLWCVRQFVHNDREAFDERFPMLRDFPVPDAREMADILGDSFVPFGRINIGKPNVNYIGKNSAGELVLLNSSTIGDLIDIAFGHMPLIVLAGLR